MVNLFEFFFLLQSLVKLKLFKLSHYFLSSLPCFIWYSYPGPLVHVWLSVSFFFGNLIGLCSLVQSPHIYACVCVCVGNYGVCMIFSRKMSVHRWQVRYIFVIFLFALLCFTHYIKRKVTFNVFVSQSIDVVILLICCYFFLIVVVFLLCLATQVQLSTFDFVCVSFSLFNLGFSENSKLTIIYMYRAIFIFTVIILRGIASGLVLLRLLLPLSVCSAFFTRNS